MRSVRTQKVLDDVDAAYVRLVPHRGTYEVGFGIGEYVFNGWELASESGEQRMLRAIGRCAADPETPMTFDHAAVLTEQLRELHMQVSQ